MVKNTSLLPFLIVSLVAFGQSRDISGTWIEKRTSPMGEMEIVYRLNVADGRITGSQSMGMGACRPGTGGG